MVKKVRRVNAQPYRIVHGDKIRETPARAQCKGNQWDAEGNRTGKKKDSVMY
jgi:hypothetical protein